jgi:hypothetical protein
MAEKNATNRSSDRPQRSLDYLRKRSQHRIWWNSSRLALRRARSQSAESLSAFRDGPRRTQ